MVLTLIVIVLLLQLLHMIDMALCGYNIQYVRVPCHPYRSAGGQASAVVPSLGPPGPTLWVRTPNVHSRGPPRASRPLTRTPENEFTVSLL